MRGIAFRQRPSRSPRQSIEKLGSAHRALHHHRLARLNGTQPTPPLGDVAHEEVLFLAVARQMDRARARAAAGLDHHRIGVGLLLGQYRRRRGQSQPREQQVGLVLVVGRARDLGGGHERGQQALGARVCEHLDVEVGERDHSPDAVALAELLKEGHVAGVGNRWRGGAHLRRVLRGCQRVGVDCDRRGQLREAGDDVVALADPGQHDRGLLSHPPILPPNRPSRPYTAPSHPAPSPECATGCADRAPASGVRCSGGRARSARPTAARRGR